MSEEQSISNPPPPPVKSPSKLIAVLVVVFVIAVIALYLATQWMHHNQRDTQRFVLQPTGDEVLDSIGRGVAFLETYQEDTGHFVAGDLAPKPAFTSLVVDVLAHVPPDLIASQSDAFGKTVDSIQEEGVNAILASQKENGGIYELMYGVYSTSLCVVALQSSDDPRAKEAVAKAVDYLKDAQNKGSDLNDGGIGYDPGARPDLNNTVNMLEALDQAGIPKDDPAYQRALKYVQNCMNSSEFNTSGVAVTDDWGFTYRPGESLAGEVETRDGKKAAKSYGTMSYAGLISFLYANVSSSDRRVRSAFQWIEKNYDLDENVGMKDAGLFYYYRIMAKALSRHGQRMIKTPDGVEHDWAKELAETVIKMQQPDGSWRNTNSTYMEGDAVLCTSYAMRTLEICYDFMKKQP